MKESLCSSKSIWVRFKTINFRYLLTARKATFTFVITFRDQATEIRTLVSTCLLTAVTYHDWPLTEWLEVQRPMDWDQNDYVALLLVHAVHSTRNHTWFYDIGPISVILDVYL